MITSSMKFRVSDNLVLCYFLLSIKVFLIFLKIKFFLVRRIED